MGVKLLRIRCDGLDNFENGSFELDFTAEKRVSADEVEDNVVTRLFGRVYKLNAIALAGINASGKTTVLTILSSLLKVYVGNGSLSYDMRLGSYFSGKLHVDAVFYREETSELYGLSSTIVKDDIARSLTFSAEELYARTASANTGRRSLGSFSESDLVMDREGAGSLLKREDSVFSAVMNSYPDAAGSVQDLRAITNHNWIYAVSSDLVVPFAQYLDPAIERIGLKDTSGSQAARVAFEIKFRQRDEAVTVELGDLELYLSSGTIKGISCLSSIAVALSRGGYVIIDEIENHLNKTIVIGLIGLFASEVNRKGATLVFSTHYSEVLDCLDRSDGIYLLEKDPAIRMRKFSEAAGSRDRRDKRKSDLVLSGTIAKGPSYRAYRNMVDSLEDSLWDGEAR